MQIKAEIKIEYPEAKQARITGESLKPDNINYVDSKIEGNIVRFKLYGESIRSMLATADDLLFCEMLVERILKDLK